MGGHEGWAQPNGFSPNGLLPNEAASVTRALDQERLSLAEERTKQLIACIQPNQPSEERREAVASYVKSLIMKCFSCKVFPFGSVPLKTYLPDGDIDLTAFSKSPNLKDTWANEVRDILEREEKSGDAEFRVKEVQYIQAEVKIIKCLVENIVVDISFNQLGGLCTLCFLEEVDHLISQKHLFKRSIILIKAWCYYESRILGAHHGLISTYALETLVLYIFRVFNNSFAGPLEVLYRFLEFFSKFDWENYCVSLWGPVPISSLPDVTADPPRKDSGELLLSKLFLDACSSVYAVLPVGQENPEQPFISKYFNVIDPLRTNNNLGRSVSKGNFFRIRSAFAFGAQRLARLLDCPKDNVIAEVNQFFMNTWERHGKGDRPDAPSPDLYGLQQASSNHIEGSDGFRSNPNRKKMKENSISHESEVEVTRGSHASHSVSSQHGNYSSKQISRTAAVYAASHTQNQKAYANLTSSITADQNHQTAQSTSSNENIHTDKGRSSRPDYLGNEVHARYQFARTHSSPELTDASSDVPSRGRRNRTSETGKGQTVPARSDYSRRRNLGSEVPDYHSARSSTENSPSSRHGSSHRSIDAAVNSNSASNSYHGESGLSTVGEDHPSVAETMQMHQEEQDRVNMMASRVHGFSGQIQMPVNLASAHLPVPISPSILASLGHAHRNVAGMIPTNMASFGPPWGSNIHYSQGLTSLPVSQYFPSVGMTSNKEMVEPLDDNLGSTEINQENNDHGFWSERDSDSMRDFDPDNGNSVGFNIGTSSRPSSSDNYLMKAQGVTKGNRGLIRENYGDNSQYQNIKGTDVYSAASSRSIPASQAPPARSKLSSEGSWDESPSKVSRSARDRRGRRTAPSAEPSTTYRSGKNGRQYEGELAEHVSSLPDNDSRNWIQLSMAGTEGAESTVSGTVDSSHVRTNLIPGYEPAQMSGSSSMLPITPMLVGSDSRQRGADNHGMVPMGNSSSSTSHLDGDEEFSNSNASQSDQNLDSPENLDQSEIFNNLNSMKGPASMEPSEEHESDILDSDFPRHLQNLREGQLCLNTRNHEPWLYPSVMPPMYFQGPWDSPGRPLSTNMNLFAQLMGYGPRLIPVSPLQPGSNRPTGVYQHYGDEVPRYRGGTGTYLPNPKISFRDRQSSNTRNHRGHYGYDRKDHHGDRDGNWNINSKPRFSGRAQGRNQVDKPNSRIDRSTSSNSQSDRSWDTFKHEPFPSYHSQNGPLSSSNSTNRGSANMAYGMYPMPVMNPNGVSPSGTGVPPVVMLYPYDQNMGYASPTDQLEFGSLGPVHFSGINEVSQLSEVSSRGVNDLQNFQGDSALSSPDQPSSPKIQSRTLTQRNQQLKEELPQPSLPEPRRYCGRQQLQ
ncbi:unnamed protein product, partial [Vitis vinifera]|uniref:Polymerase nucleotidyl transferase domain-containing protein n=1 Tax=Vitis vinifera TaxID=29760 RepID=E0CUI8_VITVI